MKKLIFLLPLVFTLSCHSPIDPREDLIQSVEEVLFKKLNDPKSYKRISFSIVDTVFLEDGRQALIKNLIKRAEKYQSNVEKEKPFSLKLRDRAMRRIDSVKALGVTEEYFLLAKLESKLKNPSMEDSSVTSFFKVNFTEGGTIKEINALTK